MKTRAVAIGAAAVLVPFLVAGCGGGSSGSGGASPSGGSSGGSASSGSAKTVAFIEGAKGNDFYTSMYCGIKAEAAKKNIQTTITGPDQFDPSLQTPIVDSVTAQHPDGVLIAPDDANAMIGPVRQMANAGIKVALVDTTLTDTSMAFSRIASNNIQGGELAAKEANKLLHGHGSVLVLSLGPGVSTDAQRVQGFQKQIKQYSGITSVGVQYTQDSTTKAASIVGSELSAHPDLSGIFATDLLSAQGAATGLRNAKANNKVTIVGFDADPTMVSNIKSGAVTAVVSQSPYQIGVKGIDLMSKVFAGQTVPKSFTTPLAIVDKNNLSDPKIAQFLYKTNC